MMPGDIDPIYLQARSVLLDALEALDEHRSAVVLVGAQAIYLHTGEGQLAVAPFTTDADLALNPGELADSPEITRMMQQAGFNPAPGQVGTWLGPHNVPVDLMVPETLGGRSGRGARLGAHGDRVARQAHGLEAALVDNLVMTIGTLEPDNVRSFEIKVAAPAALLVAKLHKIYERQDQPRRQEPKDALDVYRLLNLSTETLATGIRKLRDDALSQGVTEQALSYLEMLFGRPDAPGCQMAARAAEPLEDPATIAASCAALADDLLAAVRG